MIKKIISLPYNCLKIVKEIIDISLFVSLAIFIYGVSFFLRGFFLKKSSDGKNEILHISGAISIRDAFKKFGSLDYQFNYEGKIDVFDRIINLWCPVEYDYTLETGKFIIYERKPLLRYLRWASVLYNAFVVSFKHYPTLKVIRAWGPFTQAAAAYVISKSLDIPYCVSIHADYDLRYRLAGEVHSHVLLGSRRLGKYVEWFVLSRADSILSQFKMHTSYILSCGITPEKIKFVPHGINLDIFKQPHRCEIFRRWFPAPYDGQKMISVVGRISSDNYIDDVVKVAERILRARNDVSFVFAGDGAGMEDLKRTLKDYISAGRVVVPGFIKNELAKELRKCAAINLCLMGGFSLMEACASGNPVVAYDVEWHSELIENGVTGYLVQENDVESVVEIINLLLDNEELRIKIGSAAKKVVFARHDIEMTGRMKNEFYRQMMEIKR